MHTLLDLIFFFYFKPVMEKLTESPLKCSYSAGNVKEISQNKNRIKRWEPWNPSPTKVTL